MKFTDIILNWQKSLALTILTALLLWGWGCPSRVESLNTPNKKITRPELQIELDSIIATATYRLAELDKQDQMRDVIFNNAFAMAEQGTLNPIGIMTLLAGLYGLTRGTSDIVKRIKNGKDKT